MLKYDSRFTAQVQQWHHDVAPQIPIGDFVTYLEPKLLGLEDEAQFYAPVELSVHVKGAISDAAGAMRLHVPVHANNQWLPTLQERIGALFGVDSVELKDVCGRPLSDFSLDELDRVGKLHVFVDGKKARLNSMPEVPLEYSINKLDSIYTWYDTVKADLPKIVAQELIQCESAADLVEAIQQGGRVEQRIASHLLNTTRDVDEFVRVNHMNSPYSIEDGAARDVFGSIASSLRSTLQEFISASSKPIQNYYSAQEAKKMAERLQSKGQDASAFVPLFSQASSSSVNGFEMFESLAESMIGLPAVTDDIVNTIYVKPLGPCQRWQDEKAPEAKSDSRNVKQLPNPEKGVVVEKSKEKDEVSSSPAKQVLKTAQDLKTWFSNYIFEQRDVLSEVYEAKDAGTMVTAINDLAKENVSLTMDDVLAIMFKWDNFNDYDTALKASTIDHFDKFLQRPSMKENPEDEAIPATDLQRTLDLRDYVSQLGGSDDVEVQPNLVKRVWSSVVTSAKNLWDSLPSFRNRDIQAELKEQENATSATNLINIMKEQMVKRRGNGKDYPKALLYHGIELLNSKRIIKKAFPSDVWEIIFESVKDEKGFYNALQAASTLTRKMTLLRQHVENLSKTASFFESSIDEHNPLFAQLHHTIKPINNAFPAYYTERHLTEDMTENAPYSAPIAETYDAYHLYAGMAPFPEPVERKHKGKKWKKGKNHRRRMSHSKSVESQMPRMIPVSSKAPPVRAICSKLSKEEEEEELKKQAEKDKRTAETSLNQNHSEYRSRIGRAPPVRPIESTKKSDSDYFSKSQLPRLIPVSSKAPPVRPIECEHLSSKKKPAADSDSEEEERDYSAKSQLAPPVRPIEGKHSYKSESESDSEDDYKSSKSSVRPIECAHSSKKKSDYEKERNSLSKNQVLEKQMPTLLPVSSKAPPVRPIEGKHSYKSDSESESEEEDYKSSKSSIGRAPPVRPIDAKAEMRSRLAPIKKMPALPTVADLFK